MFDDKLSCKPHIQLVVVCSKLSRDSWALTTKIKKLCYHKNSKNSLLQITVIVYSHLQYYITSWGLASKCILDTNCEITKANSVNYNQKSIFSTYLATISCHSQRCFALS